jgi:plastocyanin
VIGRYAAAAAAVVGAAALAAVPATAGKAAPVKKTLHLGDYYMTPKKVTVPVKSTIVWKWPSVAGDSHDVKLTKTRPKGVKRFQSDIAASDFSFKRKLRVKGKYVVICSLHPTQMRQTIIVK